MPRVKGGVTSNKRRKNLLSRAKGFRHGRSKKERAAKEALLHAAKYSFNDRREKKNVFRRLFTVRINAAVRSLGFPSYSRFIDAMKKKGSVLDRKVLAEIAEKNPEVFERIVKQVS